MYLPVTGTLKPLLRLSRPGNEAILPSGRGEGETESRGGTVPFEILPAAKRQRVDGPYKKKTTRKGEIWLLRMPQGQKRSRSGGAYSRAKDCFRLRGVGSGRFMAMTSRSASYERPGKKNPIDLLAYGQRRGEP